MAQPLARSSVLLASVLLTAGPAMAGGLLAIDGAYGNKSGCAVVKNPDDVSDDLLVLNSESAASYATYCTFKTLVSETADSKTFESLCGYEGEDTQETLSLTVIRNKDDTYRIRFSSGEEWGPLARCQ